MNKKLLSTFLALSICAAAIIPIYKHLELNSSNSSISAASELEQLNPEKLEALTDDVKLSKSESTENITSEKKAAAENTSGSAASNSSTNKAVTSSKSSTENKTTANTAKSKASTSSSSESAAKATTNKAASSSSSSTKSTSSNRGTTSSATSSKASAVISTAKSLLGVPYVWGGASPSGFDCSGFTQYVLGKNGITVPRTAAEQYKSGTSVSKSNLRVGDLVFFTTYKEGPSHLGFYLGNGNFIHASSSKGVTISSLSSDYYSSRYIGARRVIN
ncbi:cell wall-associated NlpC family hydrolase [Ruminiclostridium sufflavum DSM 19573]|uniref:Cell wall-associated NlpC family hydrolase n=1 Tax=Ruminiclostridium sufflavum DSM 19573 TaxID=1121337 RepID=A0A318XZ63_9FIRM|nr:C40 family peptidase [Ruminiclostridium sufflavum]PYG88210.1 cell wall-associated NlpC family hydrolase [Ruminiclostridium sufflavum DSM 19573]